VEQGRKEIDARLATALENAANERDDPMALNLIRQCVAVKKALDAFIAWPESRVKALRAREDSVTWSNSTQPFSRRGPL